MGKSKTNEEFLKEVFKLVKDEYIFLEDYKGSNVKIKVKHQLCGNIYEVTPNKFISTGRRCPICANKKRSEKISHDKDWFKREMKKLVGDEYTVIEEYKTSTTPIKIRHNCNLCGNNEFFMRPIIFLKRNQRCPACSRNRPTEIFYKNYFSEKFKDQTDFSVSKVDMEKREVYFKHSCGKEVKKKIRYLYKIDKLLCKYCQMTSFGNYLTEDYLISKNIRFETEVSPEDLRYKLPLRFDFKIFIDSEKYFFLEIDGRQHKEEIAYFNKHSYETFDNIKQRDNAKNLFCFSNNIELHRINFDARFDKKETLFNELEKLLGHYKLC